MKILKTYINQITETVRVWLVVSFILSGSTVVFSQTLTLQGPTTGCINTGYYFSLVCNSVECVGPYSWYIAAPYTYSGSTSTTTIGPVQWTAPGTYLVTVYYQTQTGQNASKSLSVSIGDPARPSVSLTVSPNTTTCPGTSLQFSATSQTHPDATKQFSFYVAGVLKQQGSSSTFTTNQPTNGQDVKVVLASPGPCSDGTAEATLTVSRHALPTTPSIPTQYVEYQSASVQLDAPGGNETFRWYTSSTSAYQTQGTLFVFSPVLTVDKTLLITKYNTVTTCESPKANIQIIPVVSPPIILSASTNTCRDREVSFQARTDGAQIYRQTTATGTSKALEDAASNNKFYVKKEETSYFRAYISHLNRWSDAVSLTSFVDAVDIEVEKYESINTLVQATHSIKLKPGFLAKGVDGFRARIAITAECNNYVNWTEEVLYDQNGSAIGSTRVYLDGTGRTLQMQSKDYLSGRVFASQPIYDSYGSPAASTMSAPILENGFIFKDDFVREADGEGEYGAEEFDQRIGSAQGTVNNPAPVGEAPGTLGWYYSHENNLEPMTPTTDFPYSRSFAEEGPDPAMSRAAAPGDNMKMGAGHEMTSERVLYNSTDLKHYYQLRPYFVNTPIVGAVNLLGNVALNTSKFTGVGANVSFSNAVIQVTSTSTTGNPGVFPIDGSISVIPGMTYRFALKGYKTGSNQVKIKITTAAGANIVWPGNALPTGGANSMTWVSNSFKVPAGIVAIKVGLLWDSAPATTDTFYFTQLQLTSQEPSTSAFKYISTDPDGKKSVSFSDIHGRMIATAVLNGSTHESWSYTYYNDLGQVVATVAPNGVVTTSTALPGFVTYYKYDHLGRLIEVTSPDEGKSQFVYSTDGKIRFSQNEEQRKTSGGKSATFSYSNYDYLGRIVESGEYECSGSSPYLFQPSTESPSGTQSILNYVDEVTNHKVSINNTAHASRCKDWTLIEYDAEASSVPNSNQQNLLGNVSQTKNANSLTWYSYDEFGLLSWMKQNLSGIPDTRGIYYTYNYFGNVTQVVYKNEANASESNTHTYIYDKNQRLATVKTNFGTATPVTHATYKYYLHGPLKRVELGNQLQGIDYVYNINGSLKAINHADPNLDPGDDGISGGSGFKPDVFGEVLDYNEGDYDGAGYDAGNFTLDAAYPNRFSGMVKSIRWHNNVDGHVPRAYAYKYDNLNQLDDADWGSITGTNGAYGFSKPIAAYQEDIGKYDGQGNLLSRYDANGNILGLVRKGKTGNVIDNFSYNYTAGTNQLASITGSTTLGYQYNSIGQLIQQTENGNTMRMKYNAMGLISEVRDQNNTLLATYGYDDRGNRYKTSIYNAGTLVSDSYYVYDAAGNVLVIYQQAANESLSLIELPIYGSGRIGTVKLANNQPIATLYEVNDHLGNVRAVIGKPEPYTLTCTMEDNGSTVLEENPRVLEKDYYRFMNIEETAFDESALSFTGYNKTTTIPDYPNYTQTRKYSSYLYWGEQTNPAYTQSVGPAIGLKVEPGDKIDLSVWAKYRQITGGDYSRGGITGVIASLLADNFVGTAAGIDVLADALDVFGNGIGYATAVTEGNGNDESTLPHAYLYYFLYDKNFVLIDADSKRVTDAGQVDINELPGAIEHEQLLKQVTVSEPGYLYVFVANESPNTEVWFDDLKITNTRSEIVAGGDFYPFGLAMEDRTATREDYRYGYQGQFSEKDLTTGMLEFELRMYDADIGRWISADPVKGAFNSPYVGMANQPHMRIDPDGGCPPPCPIAFATIGAEIVVEGSKIASTFVLPALSSAAAVSANVAQYVGNRLANGAVKTGNDVKEAYLNSGYFANSALHTISFGFVEKWEARTQQQGYLQSGGQGFGEGFHVATSVSGGATPRPQALAIPGGSVPVTTPVVIPMVKLTDVHGNIYAKSPVNRVNSAIRKGQAPKTFERADTGKIFGEQDHVHFTDGNALNIDGSWKHGGRTLSNVEKEFLTTHGWTLP